MKTLLVLAFSLSIALAPLASAQEDPDAPKAPKNRGRAAQAARRAPNAGQPRPAVQAPRVQRNLPPAAAQQAPRFQPPRVDQDSRRNFNPGNARIRGDRGGNRFRTPDAETRVAPPVTTQPAPDSTTTTNVQSDTTVNSGTRTGAGGRDRGTGSGNNDWRNRDGQNRTGGERTGGDRNWRSGGNYHGNWTEARRHRHREHHNRSWWRSRYSRISLFAGGYYYWDNGFWFPAYGYDPYYSQYSYDEPIYGYGDLEPGQVVASVQTELQRLGYYQYAVDGLMGPATRAAIADYQRDNGLPMTSAIDGPTLSTLGLR